MVTIQPPAVLPLLGLTPVTVGADADTLLNVNWSAVTALDVPVIVVTLMSTVPTMASGDVATMLVSERTEKLAAARLPKLTALAPVKLLPVTATTVPPVVPPEEGPIALTEGADAA